MFRGRNAALSVPYVYSVSKYETTIGQYTAFLNAVARSDPNGLFDPGSSREDSIRGIGRSGTDGNYVYHVMNVHWFSGGYLSTNLPVTWIDYSDAVRFANWLHNGQGSGSTETGAYTISKSQITRASRSGGVVTVTTAQPHTLSIADRVSIWIDNDLITRVAGTFAVTAITNTTFSYLQAGDDFAEQESTGFMAGISPTHKPDARYWIPTENEWYKAAYYDPGPGGPVDDYWWFPWRNDTDLGRSANYYNGTYAETGRPNPVLFRTHLSDVRQGVPTYYGTVQQAGNVEEWTEGDEFSAGPHSRGGHWNGPATEIERIMSFSGYPRWPTVGGSMLGFRVATTANPPPGQLRAGDKIRFYPRAGYGHRMVGGAFETGDGTVIHTIREVPPNGWTEVNVDFRNARVLRYRAPNGGHGNVAEIEFLRSGGKVIGAASGTSGSWNGKENESFKAAFDGKISTFFDAPQGDGAYVEIDTGTGTSVTGAQGYVNLTVNNGYPRAAYRAGEKLTVFSFPPPSNRHYFAGWEGFTDILDDPSSHSPTATIPPGGVDLWLTATYKELAPGTALLEVVNGSGDGVYPTGTMVTVSADPPPAGQKFAHWSADTAILSNPFLPTTTALIPSMSVIVLANYDAAGPSDTIRFHPRPGYAHRMAGGVFEGTNGDPVNGPYRTVHTIGSNPPEGWSEVSVSLIDYQRSDRPQYRYLRYRGADGSYANVAEIQFYRQGARVTGTGYGSPGSWNGTGATFDQALDANVNTFFDAPTGDGAYVGIDTSVPVLGDTISFHPRSGWTERMVGGVFEGTNGHPASGPYTTIYTVASNPALGLNIASVNLGNYRYLRYRGPNGSHGNVAEISFYRNGVKLTGTGFGTPGSWADSGSTFARALDGDFATFFDAPTSDGAYVGMDTR